MKFPDLSIGLCREIGVELFYPEEKEYGARGNGGETYTFARTICSACTVRIQCLEWALHHEDHGMWGGTSPTERRVIRRKRNIRLQEVLPREYV